MKQIVLGMSKKDKCALENLARENGISVLEFFGNAASMFEWAIEEIKAGNTIVSMDEQGEHTEITMPCFEAIKKS